MKIIKPSIEVLDVLDQTVILKRLELVGRACYKSEDKITDFLASHLFKRLSSLGITQLLNIMIYRLE